MKKEYIDFDLEDYNTNYLLEKGVKIWSDPEEDIVGRLYAINYLKAPSMDELIDVTYDCLGKITSKIYFYRIYKFCVEFYPNQLYVKVYTIFNTKWDLEMYKDKKRLKYSRIKIDKGIEWLNSTFDEKVNEMSPDVSKKRKKRTFIWRSFQVTDMLNNEKYILNEIKTTVGFGQIYKIENEIYTKYNKKNDRLTIYNRFFLIFKNECDNEYDENQDVLKTFDQLYSD
jgi:hypothetical protein